MIRVDEKIPSSFRHPRVTFALRSSAEDPWNTDPSVPNTPGKYSKRTENGALMGHWESGSEQGILLTVGNRIFKALYEDFGRAMNL